jgi:hypothetical protein
MWTNCNENNIFWFQQPPAKSNPVRIIDLKNDTSESQFLTLWNDKYRYIYNTA